MAQYTPKMDNNEINRDQREPIKMVLIVIGITLVGVALLVFGIVLGLQLLLSTISLEKEQQWFSWFDHAVDGKVITNDGMKTLLTKAGVKENIKVKVMCSNELNAFAWPGGNIVLTSQLFKKLNTEEGMAFVIGHEMGHINNRDHLKGMARGLTVVIIDAFTGISQWPGSNVLINLLSSAYSRDQEIAADKESLKQMRAAFGHTKGGDEFFVVLQSEPQEKLHSKLWFISSHPLTSDRLKFFEEQNQDFLSERIITRQRDLFDQVICESGCDDSFCHEERRGSPKSHLDNNKEPITLKDSSNPKALAEAPQT